MALSTATPTVTKQWADNAYHVLGTLAVGASPLTYATGGIVCNLNIPLIKASRTPIQVWVGGAGGFTYSYVPGADNSNGLLKIFVEIAVATSPLTELANLLAIPAGVSGDAIIFSADYTGME